MGKHFLPEHPTTSAMNMRLSSVKAGGSSGTRQFRTTAPLYGRRDIHLTVDSNGTTRKTAVSNTSGSPWVLPSSTINISAIPLASLAASSNSTGSNPTTTSRQETWKSCKELTSQSARKRLQTTLLLQQSVIRLLSRKSTSSTSGETRWTSPPSSKPLKHRRNRIVPRRS